MHISASRLRRSTTEIYPSLGTTVAILNFQKITSRQFFFLYLLLLIAIVFTRIIYCIDLSDESYYASFFDEWLKVGINHSQYLMLHQTAAFLLYPFVLLYTLLIGSETGLILFLRIIYLILALVSMLSVYHWTKQTQTRLIATLTLGFGFLFIPWSLPAPSYNTIGMFSLVTGLSLFATASIQRQKLNSALGLTIGSAFSWAIAVTAYPSLLLAFTFFMGSIFLLLKSERRPSLHYLCLFSFFLCSFFSLLYWTFGQEHLLQSLEFTNTTLDVSNGLLGKMGKIKAQLLQNFIFTCLCIGAVLTGVMVAFNKQIIPLIFITASLIYLNFFHVPVLFLASHDVILFLALFGVFIPIKAIKDNSFPSIINCIIYSSSLFAGLITTITATNTLFNFPIGGLLAACMAISFLGETQEYYANLLNLLLLAIANIGMGFNTYYFPYGEIHGNPLFSTAVKINKGVFYGLRTSPTQAQLMNKVMTMLQPQDANDQRKIVVLGRFPGLYLLNSRSPSALTAWNYSLATEATVKQIKQFYMHQKQPVVILRFHDQWTSPLTTAEKYLTAQYRTRNKYPAEYGTLYTYE